MEIINKDRMAKATLKGLLSLAMLSLTPAIAVASEANLKIPNLSPEQNNLLLYGIVVCVLGMLFGLYQFMKVKKIRAHQCMLDVANIIYETCKIYLIQQGKLLCILFAFIGVCIAFYYGFLQKTPLSGVLVILAWTVIGILGSYSVAWYGIRMNTLANSRAAFTALETKPLKLLNIALDAGMSIGVLLVCVELIMMLIILLFVPRELAGASFIGFAVGESLGASALRIAGGIFTKIADISADLMKIAFGIKEDDPRNPGVIADCTGDNAGDSIGPTADGFETYGVTGVALISFIVLAVQPALTGILLTWIFVMRVLMIITSIGSFYINKAFSQARFNGKDDFDFEKPLTSLIWITSIFSIVVTFFVSYYLLGPGSGVPAELQNLWFVLSVIISCGTLGAAVIPEVTKIFTSPNSMHVAEVVKASREGGASLNILSGLVAGNFSAFWIGMVFFALMFVAYYASGFGLSAIMIYPSIFAFGLVAFGMLGMGPVTIAVDSYGPVTDNAQSIYELSLIESIPKIGPQIQKEFGLKPDFKKAKHYLEANDGAGNTFKATAKPVLIGTAVVGATTMIFSLILVITHGLKSDIDKLSILHSPFLLGLVTGGAIIYWFTGASTQAVSTGAYRAVEFIKRNIKLDASVEKASVEDSKKVVAICTNYAQKGMINIFLVVFFSTLAFACLEPFFFIGYLISIAVFGLYQAIFMANAGGAWDNAKKLVEVELKEKGTPLHDAVVVGDTVGDPFKDTSSVAMNPIIKFTTLFGLLAVELAIGLSRSTSLALFLVFFAVSVVFVYRSFYGMRIEISPTAM